MFQSLAAIVVAVLVSQGIDTRPAIAADSNRPNIVFIMADDMGYGDPGCYNKESKIPTPNIDRLAAEGIRMTDAHSPSAVCTPTRYGVLTGRYSWRSRLKKGVLWGFSPALIETGRTTVASLLKSRGYHTGCVGKWHLGLGSKEKTDYTKPLTPGPNDVGFDYFFGIPASLDMEPYVFVENANPLELPTEKIAGSKGRRDGGGGFWRGGPIAPGFRHIDVLPRITEKVVGFIRDHASQSTEKPFFLYFPLSAPHTPWLPTAEFEGKSKAGAYGDFAAQVDWSVGQVLKELDDCKLTDNTLIIFTSDNGAHWKPNDIAKYGHRANHHLRGQKADIWEGGHRVPFIARWPGNINPGTTSDETICHTDLLATCAAIVGMELPNDAGEDSYNILPVLLGRTLHQPLREATVHHSVSGVFAIRQGHWKLILGRGSAGFSKPRVIKPKPGEATGQLYNLADDPSESKNLFLDQPETVERLQSLLQKYKQQGRSR
jgi:arylsulfatase A-like enzyme